MPGRKNKSYKLGCYIPKISKDNHAALDSAYPNFVFRENGKLNDLHVDKSKIRRKLPPIPTDMDNTKASMTIGDKKTLVNPIVENTRNSISNSPGIETHPQGYQMTRNPLYDSSTTTIDSDSPPAPIRCVSSSTDPDASSLDQISQNMEEMSLEIPPELTNTSTQNPLFDADIGDSIKSQDLPNRLTVIATVESDYLSQKTHLQSCLDNSNGPFIPEPDYEEDEITIDFKSEDCDKLTSSLDSGTLLYKDYEGEDFGQYLSDEEDLIENISYTWRRNIRYNYTQQEHSRKARTEVKRQRSTSQRTAQKLFKSAPKMKGSTIRQNLRDFSFADAKISLGNAAGHAYNNRYKKNTEVPAEDEQFLRSRHSYEQFLRNRFSQNMEEEVQNWSQKEIESQHRHYEKALGYDFTGKLSRRFKSGKDAIVGRLTTKFRRKSDASYQIPED